MTRWMKKKKKEEASRRTRRILTEKSRRRGRYHEITATCYSEKDYIVYFFAIYSEIVCKQLVHRRLLWPLLFVRKSKISLIHRRKVVHFLTVLLDYSINKNNMHIALKS